MALATYSPEAKIKNGLRLLNCADYNFAKIACVVGKSRLAEGLSGQKHFDRDDADKMLNVLAEMNELQAAVGDIPIDWSRVERIIVALTMRRIVRIESELNLEPSSQFQDAARIATDRVGHATL